MHIYVDYMNVIILHNSRIVTLINIMIPYLGSFTTSAATSTIYMTLSISSLPSKHLYNICTTPAQRLRRWTNIVQMNANALFLLVSSLVLVMIMVMILVYNLAKLNVIAVFRLSSLFCHWLQLSIHLVATTVNRTFCDSTHEAINDEFHVKGNRKKSSCYWVCWRREKWKWNESGFRPPLCTYRLTKTKRTQYPNMFF